MKFKIALLSLLKKIPEGFCKTSIRRLILFFWPYLPSELYANFGDVVVLVGTPNISTIERYSGIIGNKGKLVVIEAEEANVNRLQNWKNKNRKNNIEIVQKAVWSERQELEFLKAFRPGDNRLGNERIVSDNDLREAKENGGYAEKIIVLADRIDNILKEMNISHVDFMMITINGAEFEALKGARDVLQNTARLFSKGHCRNIDTNEPINVPMRRYLDGLDFRTILTRKSRSSAPDDWGRREGDIFAYRKKS